MRLQSTSAEPEVPSGVAIFGTDDAKPSGTMLYFDQRGVSRVYEFEFENDELTWWRDDPTFRQRYTVIRVAAGRLSGRGRMSRDGGAWEGDLDVDYERQPD